MADELTRDEVEALLAGLGDGRVALEEEGAARGAARRVALVRGADESPERRFPGLVVLHERFVRELATALGSLFESAITVERREIATLEPGTLRNRIAPGAVLTVFSLVPLAGEGLLVLPPSLAFEMVDRLFGGPGKVPAEVRERPPSPIARRTIERIAGKMLGAFAAACRPVLPLECAPLRTETDPLLVSLGGAAELAVTLESLVDLGSGPVPAWLALPQAALEAARGKLDDARPSQASPDRAWLGALRAAIEQSDVVVAADLGRITLSAREVLALRVGDVLRLPTRGDDPLAVRVEGAPLLVGQAGVSRGRNALRIVGFAPDASNLEE